MQLKGTTKHAGRGDDHQILLLYFREALSLRAISRQLKISRDTVKTRIVADERFKSEPVEAQLDPMNKAYR